MIMSKVTMLLIGVVVLAIGIFIVINIIPAYNESVSYHVCHVFAFTRGFILRDWENMIPNRLTVSIYDTVAKLLPLPCKTRSFHISRMEYPAGKEGDEEFKDDFIRLVGNQIIACDNLFHYKNNNPLYPGGAGRNPFVCAVIKYDLRKSDQNPPDVMQLSTREFINGLLNMRISSLKSDENTLKDKVGFMYESEFLRTGKEEMCSGCYSITGDYKASKPECQDPACFYGGFFWAGGEITKEEGDVYLPEEGVIYVTFLDFPGKMITRYDIGNNACGFGDIVPPRSGKAITGAQKWKLGNVILHWEEAEIEPSDVVLLCYEPLNT